MRALLLLLLLVTPAVAQDEVDVEEREEALGDEVRELVDPDPTEHLGWGSPEDLFVELGAGAAISVLSGALVLHVEPLPRPGLPHRVRFALTYSHGDEEGAPELGPGWAYDLGRSVLLGAYGERILVDADGFRDTFWAGPPPTPTQLDGMTREVVKAWRRSTPASERRALGGVAALEELLTSDPTTLGAMHLRYHGAGAEESPPELYRSGARGVRTLRRDGDDLLLDQTDGTVERYGPTGTLTSIQSRGGETWTLRRVDDRLEKVLAGESVEWTLETDARRRVARLLDATGNVASFEYVGQQLTRIDARARSWRFRYDGRGRITSAETPDGEVRVTYDDSTGRVVRAEGPVGRVSLRAEEDGSGLRVDLELATGEALRCLWSPERRTRTLERGGQIVERVRFAPSAALPVEVESASGLVSFAWSDGGRLLSARRGGREVRWQRDGDGVIGAIEAPGGERAVVLAGAMVQAVTDPAGRRIAVERDDVGRARALLRTGGPDLRIVRGPGGVLGQLAVQEGPQLSLPTPGKSTGELRWEDRSAGLSFDGSGRLLGFEDPLGRSVRLGRDGTGRVAEIGDGRGSASLLYADGLLSGWAGTEGAPTITRDASSRPSSLRDGANERWSVSRGVGGEVLGLTWRGSPLRIEGDGGPQSWERPEGASTRLVRDRDGAVIRVEDDGLGSVDLDLDAAGRPLGVRRGTGRWALSRDASGRVRGVTDPGGGATDLTLGPGGRATSIGGAEGQRWDLRHDVLGRLVALAGLDGEFSLTRGRDGAPQTFLRVDGRAANLTWDRRGRVTQIAAPDLGRADVTWGSFGPTRLGKLGLRYDAVGALQGWGPLDSEDGGTLIARDATGRGKTVRQGAQEVGIRRDATHRPLVAGDWEARFGRGLLGLAGPGVDWVIERDAAGRARSFAWAEGQSASIDRDAQGDARAARIATRGGVLSLEIERDPSGRIAGLGVLGSPIAERVSMTRDLLGRVEALGLERERGAPTRWTLRWRDAAPSDKGVLGEALAVQREEERRIGSAARDLGVAIGGATKLSDAQRPGVAGLLTGTGGATEAGARKNTARWGPALLAWNHAPVLPSPVGAGGLLLGAGMRVPGVSGRTLAWVTGGAVRLADRLDPPDDTALPAAGDAALVWRWWTGLGLEVGDALSLPDGLPESTRAWAHGARSVLAAGSSSPDDAADADAGVLLGPIPGAGFTIPGPAGTRRVGALEALVLSGDLEAEALLWSDLLDLPADPWQIDLPGAGVLAALLPRLQHPDRPPLHDGDDLAVVEPGARGLLTTRGRELERRRAWDVVAAVPGLPAGVLDLLPGTPGWVAAGVGTSTLDGRATALDALSDDPLGLREAAQARASSTAILLALRTLSGAEASALGGLVPDGGSAESWLIELPSGTRVVVDGRGRLLSVDAGGRLSAAFDGALAARLGQWLLAPPTGVRLDGPFDRSPLAPSWLPERGASVESRWGLLPGTPELPLGADGLPRVGAP